jgi:hypothetical protein
VTVASFKALTERVCRDFMSYEGGASARLVIGNDPTVMTVTEPSHSFAIPLHGEMYYTRHRPDILWFYCVRPAERDGETTFAEGSDVLAMLSPPTRGLFEDRGIKYVCTYLDGRWQSLFRTSKLDVVRRHCADNDLTLRIDLGANCIVTEYASRAIGRSRFDDAPVFVNNVFAMTRWESLGFGHRVVRLDDGSHLPEEVVQELQAIEADAAQRVAWQPGDIVMIDNTRFLHGRRAFTDLRREIYVRLSAGLRERD